VGLAANPRDWPAGVLEELSEHLRAPETEAYVLEHADLLRRPTGAVAG